jgi:hypothetical protein
MTEQVLRHADLLDRAIVVFGENAPDWMATPHALLDGKTPAEFAINELGSEKVRRILGAIEHGGVVGPCPSGGSQRQAPTPEPRRYDRSAEALRASVRGARPSMPMTAAATSTSAALISIVFAMP